MLRVLSLGAGVQSTTLALMAAHGEIEPPDCAIFADTQAEPASVYEHLRWLMSPNVLPFPVHVVTAGSLRSQLMSAEQGKTHGRPPLYVRNPDGSKGILHRQCTGDFKIDPIQKEIRRLLGLKRGQRWPTHAVVEQWMGISRDEIERIKPSDRPAIVRRYPLVDLGMRRWDCEQWLQRHGYPIPSKSACTFCPYRSDAEWRRLREDDPTGWDDAVAIDRIARTNVTLVGEVYFHRSLVPLDEVDFSVDDRQGDLFGNECEGMCGV